MKRPAVSFPPSERVCRLELASIPSAVGWARRHAADVLGTWGMGDLTDTALLVVSELVTNAIQHGMPDGERVVYRVVLVMRLVADAVVLEVFDPDPNPPVSREQSPDAEGGRGLFLVETLSMRWDYYLPRGGGKTVWAALAVPGSTGDEETGESLFERIWRHRT